MVCKFRCELTMEEKFHSILNTKTPSYSKTFIDLAQPQAIRVLHRWLQSKTLVRWIAFAQGRRSFVGWIAPCFCIFSYTWWPRCAPLLVQSSAVTLWISLLDLSMLRQRPRRRRMKRLWERRSEDIWKLRGTDKNIKTSAAAAVAAALDSW